MTKVLPKKKKKAKNSLNIESTVQVHKQLRTKTQTSTTNQGAGHLVMMPTSSLRIQCRRKEGGREGREEGGKKRKATVPTFDLRQNKDADWYLVLNK